MFYNNGVGALWGSDLPVTTGIQPELAGLDAVCNGFSASDDLPGPFDSDPRMF